MSGEQSPQDALRAMVRYGVDPEALLRDGFPAVTCEELAKRYGLDLEALQQGKPMPADVLLTYAQVEEQYGVDPAKAIEARRKRLATVAAAPKPPAATSLPNARPPAKRRRNKRPPLTKKELTRRQVEVVQIVGECKGNIAEAARRLVLDPKTVKQHYEAAQTKLGKSIVKHATQALPADRRGQANLVDGQDRRL